MLAVVSDLLVGQIVLEAFEYPVPSQL